MPYIKAEQRSLLSRQPLAIESVGDLNYLAFTKMVEIWNSNKKYETVHKIKKLVRSPDSTEEFGQLLYLVPKAAIGYDAEDVKAAIELAFLEFYRRIVAPYENQKAKENGDLV